MALFCALFSYPPETWSRLVASPVDRTEAVRSAVEQLGGRVHGLYYMLGPFDGLLIGEIPDERGAAALATLAVATGAYARMETHTLLHPADLVEALGRAGGVATGFVAPGAGA